MPRRGCHYWLLLFIIMGLLLLGQLVVVVVATSSRSAAGATNPPPHDHHPEDEEEDVTSSWKRLYYESSSSSSSSDETERLLRTWTNNEEESSILRSMETTMIASMEDHDERRSDHDDGDEEEQVEEVYNWRSSLPAGTTGKPARNYEADRLDGRTRGGGSRTSRDTNPERMEMSSSSTTTKTRRSGTTPSTPRPHSNHHDGETLSFAQILNMATMSIREDDTVPFRPAGFFLHPPPRTSRSKRHNIAWTTTTSTRRTARPHQPSFLLSRGVKLLEVRTASINQALLLRDSCTIQLVTRTEDPLRLERHVVVLAQHTIRLVDSTRQQGTSGTTTTTRNRPTIPLSLTSSANGTVAIAPTLPSSLSATTTVTAQPPDESTTSSSTTTTYWIRDFIKCHWQHGLFPVPRDFLLDNFNLANLPALLNITADEFRHAWKTLLQARYVDNNDDDDDDDGNSSDDESSSSKHHEEDHHPQQQHNNSITTIRLFLLLHQRFILSPRGLHLAHRQLLLLRRRQRRRSQNDSNNRHRHHHHHHHGSDHGCFGRCPALSCRGSRTVPIGRSDLPGGAGGGTAVAHAYCPQCRHVWVNWDWQDDPVVDGCAWGTTFGHLLLLVYGTAAAAQVGSQQPQRGDPLPDESSPSISLTSALSSSSSTIEQPYVPRICGFRLHPSAAGLCG
jgi:Casein kinase II regulatory subunit